MEFRVFYMSHETEDRVDATEPYLTDRDTMVSMAQQLLRGDGDFFGIIDERGTTLQFIMQGEDDVWMEIPMPSKGGSYGRVLPIENLETMLLSIEPPFLPSRIEGLNFQQW